MRAVSLLLLCAAASHVAAATSTPALTISNAVEAVVEGGVARFKVRLTAPAGVPTRVSVSWTTKDLTATAGEDYVAMSDVLDFTAAGEQEIQVPVLADEALGEGSEVFFVKLVSATNARIDHALGHGVIHGHDDNSATVQATCDLDHDGRSNLLASHNPPTLGVGPPVVVHDWDLDGTQAGPGSGGIALEGQSGELPSWRVLAINDFDGTGTCDLVWESASTGQLALALTPTGGTFHLPEPGEILRRSVPDAPWTFVGSGHFNGDHRADLLWWNASTRNLMVWFLSIGPRPGLGSPNGVEITDQDLPVTITGIGDPVAVLNTTGGAYTGILWRHPAWGALTYWRLRDLQIFTTTRVAYPPSSVIDLTWRPSAVGDFDGDGGDDLIWQESTPAPSTSGGRVAVWFLRDINHVQESFLSPEFLDLDDYLPGIVAGPR